MAEFTRKTRSKQIVESIDTKKSSKREVYDFYLRWKKQYGGKGRQTLDYKKASKAAIVRELSELEARQHIAIQEARGEKGFEKAYEKFKKKQLTPSQAAEELKKLQKRAEKLEKAGKLSKGKANIFAQTTEQPKPRKRGASRSGQRKNVYYKGRYAHDFIKKMCDEALIDTEDFEDSQEIWYAISLMTGYSEEFTFFKDNYEGEYAQGSRDYYLGSGGFEEFLKASDYFERAMKSEGKKIPDRLTREYWDALNAWIDSKGGITKLWGNL